MSVVSRIGIPMEHINISINEVREALEKDLTIEDHMSHMTRAIRIDTETSDRIKRMSNLTGHTQTEITATLIRDYMKGRD